MWWFCIWESDARLFGIAELRNLTRLVSEKVREFVFTDRLEFLCLLGDAVCTQMCDLNFQNWGIRVLADLIKHPCNLLGSVQELHTSKHKGSVGGFYLLTVSCFFFSWNLLSDICPLCPGTSGDTFPAAYVPFWPTDLTLLLGCCHLSDRLSANDVWNFTEQSCMESSPTDSPLTVLRDPPSGRKVCPETVVNIVRRLSYLNHTGPT